MPQLPHKLTDFTLDLKRRMASALRTATKGDGAIIYSGPRSIEFAQRVLAAGGGGISEIGGTPSALTGDVGGTSVEFFVSDYHLTDVDGIVTD